MTEIRPGPMPLQVFQLFREYRCYITPDFFLVTYQDADLVKIMRNTSHRPGFLLLLVQLIWELVTGSRTALRERWALWNQDLDADAEVLGLQCRAARGRVLEFWFESGKPRVKGEEGQ